MEALVRSGVGAIDVIDDDKVCLTNLNRQIIATRKTIGQYKTDVCKERIHDINPNCEVTVHKCFFLPETKDQFDFSKYDYVVDAVDTVTAKIALVMACQEAGTPIISSMGAGNKLNPAEFEVADIYKTSVCPLAKVMRRELLSTLRSYTLRKSPFVLLRIWESAVVLTVYVLREQPTNVQKDAIFRVQPHLYHLL